MEWYAFNVGTLALLCVLGLLVLSAYFILQEERKQLKKDRATFEQDKARYRSKT